MQKGGEERRRRSSTSWGMSWNGDSNEEGEAGSGEIEFSPEQLFFFLRVGLSGCGLHFGSLSLSPPNYLFSNSIDRVFVRPRRRGKEKEGEKQEGDRKGDIGFLFTPVSDRGVGSEIQQRSSRNFNQNMRITMKLFRADIGIFSPVPIAFEWSWTNGNVGRTPSIFLPP